ncbi:hypothetical protein BH11PLA2_BH11PLA2_39270 [soil metagenome]
MDYIDYRYQERVRPYRTSPLIYVALVFAILLVLIAFSLPRIVYGDRCLKCMGARSLETEPVIEGGPPDYQTCPACHGTGKRVKDEATR